MRHKIFPASLLLFVMIAGYFTLRPVDAHNPDRQVTINGLVSEVRATASGDLQILLHNDEHVYYLNRAVYQGLSLDAFQAAILDQDVSICYASHWSLLNLTGQLRPTLEVLCPDGEYLYLAPGPA